MIKISFSVKIFRRLVNRVLMHKKSILYLQVADKIFQKFSVIFLYIIFTHSAVMMPCGVMWKRWNSSCRLSQDFWDWSQLIWLNTSMGVINVILCLSIQRTTVCKVKGSLKKTATHILYVHENICPHFIFVLLPLMPEGKFKNGQILMSQVISF